MINCLRRGGRQNPIIKNHRAEIQDTFLFKWTAFKILINYNTSKFILYHMKLMKLYHKAREDVSNSTP